MAVAGLRVPDPAARGEYLCALLLSPAEESSASFPPAGGLVHRLKTPVTVIRGYITTVLAGKMGPVDPTIAEKLRTADREAQLLTEMIDDLIRLFEVGEAGGDGQKSQLDLSEMVRSAAEEIQSVAEAKGLKLDTVVKEDLPPVLGNSADRQAT